MLALCSFLGFQKQHTKKQHTEKQHTKNKLQKTNSKKTNSLSEACSLQAPLQKPRGDSKKPRCNRGKGTKFTAIFRKSQFLRAPTGQLSGLARELRKDVCFVLKDQEKWSIWIKRGSHVFWIAARKVIQYIIGLMDRWKGSIWKGALETVDLIVHYSSTVCQACLHFLSTCIKKQWNHIYHSKNILNPPENIRKH